MEKLYSTFDLSKQTGISERDVRALIRTGAIPGKLIAGRWITDQNGLDKAFKFAFNYKKKKLP